MEQVVVSQIGAGIVQICASLRHALFIVIALKVTAKSLF